MYRHFVKLGSIFLFILMLAFPAQVFEGASNGLLLWFRNVLPTLLPFIILSNLVIKTRAADLIARIAGNALQRILHVSPYGSFAVVAGFLCGYPMGAKVTADMLRERRISYDEAAYLLSFCNNASPGFIISYVVLQNLRREELRVPALVILISAPVLAGLLFRKTGMFFHINNPFSACNIQSSCGGQSFCKDMSLPRLADACIMDGFEIITKIGGYMMLFSVFITLAELLPFSFSPFRLLLLPSLEVTYGIALVCESSLSESVRFLLTMTLTSFGGWCAVAQTACVTADTGLSIKNYALQKLITAAIAGGLTLLYLGKFFC